jgi:hypothetical protein
MPTQLEITDGPPARKFIFHSGAVTGDFSQDFTIKEKGAPVETKKAVTVHHIGRTHTREPDGDVYGFTASYLGEQILVPNRFHFFNIWFLIGTYNVRTRKGLCVRFTDEEFLSSPHMKALWGDYAQEMIRDRKILWDYNKEQALLQDQTAV